MGASRTVFFALALALLAICFIAPSVAQQSDELLNKKVARLHEKASAHKGVIPLDSEAFEKVMTRPRNYSMAILFTAMSPEFQCIPCKNFDPEYRLAAAGWSKLPDTSRVFFASIDFKVGQAVFQAFGMTSAPSVLYFPATAADRTGEGMDGALNHDQYDFNRNGFQAEPFAHWISGKINTPLAVKRPFDFMDFALKILFVIGVATTARVLYMKAGTIFRGKYIWAVLSLVTIFVMISGHMWNQIRKPGYTVPNADGRPSFIAPGFQNQYGLETQVIAVLYAILCGSFVALISLVPNISSPNKQRISIWIWMGVITIIYSLLIQIFRLKNPNYPFRLLF